jgi:hypothetical protein
MKAKQVKLPGPDHAISIQRNPARVVVSVAGRSELNQDFAAVGGMRTGEESTEWLRPNYLSTHFLLLILAAMR